MSKQAGSPHRECVICGSKAIGFNFGVLTCAPCKAFFRRNARRREILESPCSYHQADGLKDFIHQRAPHSTQNLQIRHCPSCRLHRCFDQGMKEESVRTEEENTRHKQLVIENRQRRERLRQRRQDKVLPLFPILTPSTRYIREADWCHLSNIVSAFETHCLKTYLQQRLSMSHTETPVVLNDQFYLKHSIVLPMNLVTSALTFFRSLPAYHSLVPAEQMYLNQVNLRPLLFVTMLELSQTCFSEPWQIFMEKSTWRFLCGNDLYEEFVQIQNLGEKLYIRDPIITRLWMVILFFSSALFFLYEKNSSTTKYPKTKTAILNRQNMYITLLWNYLLHRYGDENSIQIYSNLVKIYLKMQLVGCKVGFRVRSRQELSTTYQTLNQVLTVHSSSKKCSAMY